MMRAMCPPLQIVAVLPIYVPDLATLLGIDALLCLDDDLVFIDADLSPQRLGAVYDQVLADVAETASVAYCATA